MSDSVIPWTVACHAPLSTGILQARTLEWEDDGGVGGHGVQLSPHIHQEYIFRRKSACRTPAESRQEYLIRGKEYMLLLLLLLSCFSCVRLCVTP